MNTALKKARAHTDKGEFKKIIDEDVPEMRAGILNALQEKPDGISSNDLWNIYNKSRSARKKIFSWWSVWNNAYRRSLAWAIAIEELLTEKRMECRKGVYYPKQKRR